MWWGKQHKYYITVFKQFSLWEKMSVFSTVMSDDEEWCVGFVPERPSAITLEEILSVELFNHRRRFINLSADNKQKLEEWGFCFDENNAVQKTPVPWKEGIRFLKTDPRFARFVLDDGRVVFEVFIRNTRYVKMINLRVNDKRTFDQLYEKLHSYLKRLKLLNVDINFRQDINNLTHKLQRNLTINNETVCCVETDLTRSSGLRVEGI